MVMVVPFDLTGSMPFEKQVHNIIASLNIAKDRQPILFEYDWDDSTFPLVAAESMLRI